MAIITPTMDSPPRSPDAMMVPLPSASNLGASLSAANLTAPPTAAVADK